jgi:hypothetical protein
MVSMFEKSNPRFIIRLLNVYSLLALAGIVGPIVLGVADLAAGLSVPWYNPIRDSISSLALTPMGWLQTIGFLVIGLLVEVFAAGLLFSIRGGRVFKFGIAILAWFGFDLLLVGAFRTDMVGTPRTIEGTIHGAAATTVFWLFPIACLLIASSLRNSAYWKDLFVYTIVTSVLASVFMLVRLWLPLELSWFGLYERVLVYNVVIWLEVMAIRLLRLSILRGHI